MLSDGGTVNAFAGSQKHATHLYPDLVKDLEL
jgi:hypothetical protein